MTTMVVPADAPEAVWLAARREGIGASEISAVLGISPWESPFSLFWRKVNAWEIDDAFSVNPDATVVAPLPLSGPTLAEPAL